MIANPHGSQVDNDAVALDLTVKLDAGAAGKHDLSLPATDDVHSG